eukprot:TRINITY_DN9175_c0_g1_i2.p1 TRINITY_DN9175_c0_g1~~TRINITY_DN9175_c0_g1_i2.p1  ORF type:complete len:368 (-),score=98.27 TRINITY_DN9175_c0_g1_i2:114-1160(-)
MADEATAGAATTTTAAADAQRAAALEEARLKRERRIVESIPRWREVLQNWDKQSQEKGTREMWWAGIPPSLRGKVWCKGIKNTVNATPELFKIFAQTAAHTKKMLEGQDSNVTTINGKALGKAGSVKLIGVDLPRTFANLSFFSEGGPLRQPLQQVLEAYVCYRPDVGYVQGMSYLVAVLLLNMEAPEAFVCMVNILHRPCYHAFYLMDIEKMDFYLAILMDATHQYLPRVYKNFVAQGVEPKMFFMEWMLTIYSKPLPMDLATHIWDVYVLEGESFIFRVALAIFHMFSKVLEQSLFDEIVNLLTNLTQQDISDEVLFTSIHAVTLTPKRFDEIAASHKLPAPAAQH